MATDIERLVVSLEASTVRYERALQRAMGQTNQTARRIESRFDRMNRGIGAGFAGLQRNIAAAFAGVAATRGATQLIDAATRIENSLKVAGLAGQELERVYDSLFQSAQRNAAPIESLATLYGRLAIVQNELGASTEEMLSFTDNVAVALRVAGTDAQSASGALLQLSQAMGSGIVRAEEFNSILEGALPIAQAAAAGLEEAGGSVAKLRQLVVDGKVSSEAFFRAFEAGSVVLQDKVANAELTVSQGFVRLMNVLIDTAREMNEGSRVSGALVDGLDDLGRVIQEVAGFAEAAVGPIQTLAGWLQSGSDAANNFANGLARLTGLEGIGSNIAPFINDLNIPGLTAGSSAHGRVLSQSFELLGETPQDEALAAILAGENPPPLQITVHGTGDAPVPPPRPDGLGSPPTDRQISTVSLDDYSLPPGLDSGSGKKKLNPYQRALEQQRERLRMLEMETALTRTLSPLVNDYGYAVERLRTQMELENAAAEAGLELTPERRAEIEQLAEGYATATANAARLAEQQDMVRQTAEQMGQVGQDAIRSIIDGFIEGKNAGDILLDVIGQIGNQLLNMGLNGLFGGGGGFNPLGFLFGGIPGFATGTANTGGARGQVRGLVHGQEAVIPLPNGGRVPVEMRMPSVPTAGTNQSPIPIEIFVSPTGEFDARVARIADGRAQVAVVQGVKGIERNVGNLLAEHQERY